MTGHDPDELSQSKGLGAPLDPRNREGVNNGDNKIIRMAGSGPGVGISKEAHENSMSPRSIS